MISGIVQCDVYRIEPVEPYPTSYDETVERNVCEQNSQIRPAIANPVGSLANYDAVLLGSPNWNVLLGSPNWNVRSPMIMSTFAESHDFRGRRIFPFVTYAVSGLGSAVRDYTESCPGAQIGAVVAVRGEDVSQHRPDVERWLRQAGLIG